MQLTVVIAIITATQTHALAQDSRARELFYHPAPPSPAAPSPKVAPSKKNLKKPHPWAGRSVGLKCWLETEMPDGKWTMASQDHPFYSGQRIRVHVQANTEGRLSILQKQDDGSPVQIFPGSKSAESVGLVKSMVDTPIEFIFDDVPGQIRLFFLLKPMSPDPMKKLPPRAVLAEAESTVSVKGLRLVDHSLADPAMFVVEQVSSDTPVNAVAAEMLLVHKAR